MRNRRLQNMPVGHRVLVIQPTPRMRLKTAFMRVLHLIRLRKLWSQCGAALQVGGRRSFLRQLMGWLWICPRRGHRSWTLRQCWIYLGPIVRRHAGLFKHLVSRHGHLQHRSKPRERHFRLTVLAQIDNNGWWNWTDVAIRSRHHLGQDLDHHE